MPITRHKPSHKLNRSQHGKHNDHDNDEWRSFYWSRAWRRLRELRLRAEPLCRFCMDEGRLTDATEVDHIVMVRERPDLRLDYDNTRSLCKTHHSRLTMQQTGERRHASTTCQRGGSEVTRTRLSAAHLPVSKNRPPRPRQKLIWQDNHEKQDTTSTD
jgi:5-methylcytosine-specific restriction endonuclease McrA